MSYIGKTFAPKASTIMWTAFKAINAGFADEEVLALIKERHPYSVADLHHVRWYRRAFKCPKTTVILNNGE